MESLPWVLVLKSHLVAGLLVCEDVAWCFGSNSSMASYNLHLLAQAVERHVGSLLSILGLERLCNVSAVAQRLGHRAWAHNLTHHWCGRTCDVLTSNTPVLWSFIATDSDSANCL